MYAERMSLDETYTRTALNRLRVASVLDSLATEQWDTMSLCAGWTVRHVAAHLVQPMLVGFTRFFATSLRYRGDTAATVNHLTGKIAGRQPGELIDLLREHAYDRVNPPRVGPMGPFAETCIHLRDIALPLALDANVPLDDWHQLLIYLCSTDVAPSLVPRQRVDGLRLRATDISWRHGSGPEVTGTAEAIAMTITGRSVALADLHGPGTSILSSRI